MVDNRNQLGRDFIVSNDIKLSDLMCNEIEEIIMSEELYAAFDAESKTKRNYSKHMVKYLYKYVICLYNCGIVESADQLDSLTYLERIVEALETLKPKNLLELSLDPLNDVLDSSNSAEMYEKYKNIEKNRCKITSDHYTVFREMLKENHNTYKGKHDVFNYVREIYNNNKILQDNVDYLKYLSGMAKLTQSKIYNMRMVDILDMYNVRNVNFETINESKKIINDLTQVNLLLN